LLQSLYDFFSNLTYAVSFSHPLSLVVLYIMGLITDIGVPLLFSLEIFLLFASYFVGPFSIQVLLIVLMLLLGRESGAAILYWISYTVGDPFLHWLQKYFPWFIKSANSLKSIIRQRIILIVVVVRLTPGFLQVPSILTGSLRLSYPRFAFGVAISSLIMIQGW
jgi:membrane protein DedA with SNARE-associated domain